MAKTSRVLLGIITFPFLVVLVCVLFLAVAVSEASSANSIQ